jgi:aminoglycoside phosphotransferase (APT) family kinase protein
MRALCGTAVPVPQVLASCEDVSIIGAPFYLMDFVEGSTFRSRHDLGQLCPNRVRSLSEEFIDVLARIHSVDHREVGLQDFGRPDGYLARQVSRWQTQMQASHSRDLLDADRLVSLLTERVPSSGPVGIVHGDYRLDNVIVDDHDRPAAVIDWEMSTIGDVLSDLGLTVVYMRLAAMVGGARAEVVADASTAEGFITEDDVLDRYARLTGRDLGDFGFYLGLASFKLAGILEGIHFRYLQGQTLGPGFESIGDTVGPLLAAGLDSMKEKY